MVTDILIYLEKWVRRVGGGLIIQDFSGIGLARKIVSDIFAHLGLVLN